MIPYVNWPHADIGGLPSPFHRDTNQRPLRLTFHTSTLGGLSDEEPAALEALYELSRLPDIHPLQTGNGAFPQIEIGTVGAVGDHIPVTVQHEDGSCTQTGIWFVQLPDIATHLVGGGPVDSPNAKAMLADLTIAQAHCALGQDILVTTSPWLLNRRTEGWVREANPHLPSEAAHVVGLFLRSRDNYTWRASEMGRSSLDRSGFYWVLARHRLPSMWRYFSACYEAGKVRADDTFGLAESILSRCVRALQARDAIGQRFCMTQVLETRDEVMYHFDYLSLLLAGAFDAQARIAHRACRVKRPNERWATFHGSRSGREFKSALKQHGATKLHSLVSGQDFEALTTLVYTLRNTIHGVAPKDLIYSESRQSPDADYAQLSQKDGEAVWQAAEQSGSPERWGLMRNHITGVEPYLLEPYTYSTVLVQECLKMVDRVAALTDIDGLFPDGYSIPKLMDKPPEDGLFRKEIRERLAVLG